MEKTNFNNFLGLESKKVFFLIKTEQQQQMYTKIPAIPYHNHNFNYF